MRVHVNDEPHELPDGSTVADVLAELDVPARGVAVALDGSVVRRAEWSDVVVTDGARVEVLTAVQGG
ncbi:sulfur carrier protein ThiS [Prauserella rugosa]|uniref:Sulfur carrier protein n=1 Tax=Prauserella rugosa TaxID=43354 RepID=A0A660CCG9_9PSEU|nr:sulfur carrier protein ThiS [Prauserella rugosa]KID31723.1 thiamine biosynthesis protein ThiS [Prauserella sp. Am3]KMS80211.1 thiamine biosynthesis protein ThiS [Streptomyces regensis]TWH21046.1 sulfur carrier protein [Prauserella rugosa]